MNADQLLTALSKTGDNPNRIQQVRKIAIALAVSGKLNGRSVALEPSDILEAVEQVKNNLIKQGVLPKQKKSSDVMEDQLPENFTDPSRFARLGSLAKIEKGLTGIKQAQPGSFPMVVTAAERTSCDHYDFDGSAAIVPLVSSTGHGHASLNRLHYQEGKFALGTILVAIFPHDPGLISPRFLFEYLSAFKEELLVSRMTGTANVTLSAGRIAEVPVPLIYPEVQNKIDELMALCDRLEAARAEREATRDRLAAASLARLNAPDPDPETFQSHARFALDNLAPLTTRPDQIKQLRQTILNLAVQGKLVEQNPADEPASELLKKILAKKSHQVAAGKMRAQTPLEPVSPDECEFLLPPGWGWSRLGEVVKLWNGFAFKSSDFGNDGEPVIRIGDLQDGIVDLSNAKRVPSKIAASVGEEIWIPENALLLAMSGATTGKTAFNLTGQKLLLNQRVGRIAPFLMNIQFIRFFFETIVARNLNISLGTAIPNLSAKQINETAIPLPPLAEQHRIVAKVDELMALCDRLEAALATADTTRQRLLEALLHEALTPGEDQEAAA